MSVCRPKLLTISMSPITSRRAYFDPSYSTSADLRAMRERASLPRRHSSRITPRSDSISPGSQAM
jgi:hypothetical protein